MKKALVVVSGFLLAIIVSISSASAQNMNSSHLEHHPATATTDPGVDSEMQDWAKQRLAKSPRHQEWVKIKYKPAGGTAEREVSAFVVFPEVKSKATSVLVIHEIFGMSDWVQSLTDQLAEAGFVAIAPDLLSGMGPNGGGTSEIRAADSTAVGKAIRDLPPDQITADLNAVADYVAKLPAANGKIAVTGYCWGGSQSFRYATNNQKLKAAFVFYGSAPESKDELTRIKTPVYGFYAGNDARINATLPKTTEVMKELGKAYDPVTYEGAGHGYMRAGDAPEPKAAEPKGDKEADEKAAADYQKEVTAYKANKKARDEAWVRWKALLVKL
jgi:carboxymethylenebutenolidase